MIQRLNQKMMVMIALVVLGLWCSGPGYAGDKQDMGGWEKDSPYNKLYNAAERDSFKATVVDIKEVVPMPGMSPGWALVVQESKNEDILVHLCPTWFVERKGIGFKKGDRVKVRGVWAEVNGKDVFLASKIKKGNFFSFKVRLTKDGTPFWTMSPARLAKERTQN